MISCGFTSLQQVLLASVLMKAASSYSNFAAANHSYDDLAISISLGQFGQGQILYSEADKLYRWNTTAGSCSAIFTLPYETIYATLVKLGEEYLLLCAYPTTVDTHPYLINSSYAVQQTNLTNHLAHSCVKLDDDLYWVQRQRLENSTSWQRGTYRISEPASVARSGGRYVLQGL